MTGARPARGGGARGGLDWQRRPGWNSGGVRRRRRGPAARRPARRPQRPLLHSQPQFPACTVGGMGACQVGAELKLGTAVNSSELVASPPVSSARPGWTSVQATPALLPALSPQPRREVLAESSCSSSNLELGPPWRLQGWPLQPPCLFSPSRLCRHKSAKP